MPNPFRYPFNKKKPNPIAAVYAGPEEMARRNRPDPTEPMEEVYAGPPEPVLAEDEPEQTNPQNINPPAMTVYAGPGMPTGGLSLQSLMAQMKPSTEAPEQMLDGPGMVGQETVGVCPNCGRAFSAWMKYCPECGTLQEWEPVCPGCGAVVPRDAKFCPECGRGLQA